VVMLVVCLLAAIRKKEEPRIARIQRISIRSIRAIRGLSIADDRIVFTNGRDGNCDN